MENKLQPGARGNSGVVLGALLIIAGFLSLAARFTPIDLGAATWPLYVIVSGLAMIVLSAIGRTLQPFAIIGSIVLVAGLVLAVQNAFGVWAAWSYAWALVVPGAIGLGVAIIGAERRDGARVQRGLWMLATGVAMATIFGLFFEGLLHVSGIAFEPFAGIVFPVFLIAFGFAMLAAAVLSRRARAS